METDKAREPDGNLAAKIEAARQVAAADERRRIGQEIHDGLGQELTGLRYVAQTHAEALSRQSLPEAETAERIVQWLERIQTQLAAIARSLVPEELKPGGLVSALRGLAEQTATVHRLACTLECERPVEIPSPLMAAHLYRIAQEAVSNAVRHASAGHVTIQLDQDEEGLRLQVADDGVGIASASEEASGLGMHTMANRAGAIGATLRIDKPEQGGTAVTCTVPKRIGRANSGTGEIA